MPSLAGDYTNILDPAIISRRNSSLTLSKFLSAWTGIKRRG